MAVVQISRIQVRRGQKNQTGTIPQLSSGEFAWAVDTQELFIGNGSISEGAPYVGNTKILTEHDNILELANSYKFAENDPTIVKSIFRSLQSKLDETVSVIDFGAVPDGSSDCTEAFERAFEELFSNPDDKRKKILFVPNGVYLFLLDLKIPSNVILVGENPRETVFDIKNRNIIFVSENGTEPGSFSASDDVPVNIKISNLTIDHDRGQTEITAARNCEFENVRWRSDYSLGDEVVFSENANGIYIVPIISTGGIITVTGSGVSTSIVVNFVQNFTFTLELLVSELNGDPVFNSGPSTGFVASVDGTALKISSKLSTEPSSIVPANFTVSVLQSNAPGETPIILNESAGTLILSEFADGLINLPSSVFWNNKLFGIATNRVKFSKCEFTGTATALKTIQESKFDTEIIVDDCRFSNCNVGIFVDGIEGQGNLWQIRDVIFESIAEQAIFIKNGRGTKIYNTVFRNVGGGNQTAQYPTTSIVKFGEPLGNVLFNCSSDRHQLANITTDETTPGVVEFENISYASLVDRNYSDIFVSNSFRPLSVFSAFSRFIIIDYSLELGTSTLSRYTRVGRLTITIGDDLEGTQDILQGQFSSLPGEVSEISIADSYFYSPNNPRSSGGKLMTDFNFAVELRDNDEDSGVDTIILKYKNPIATGAAGIISYSITTGV